MDSEDDKLSGLLRTWKGVDPTPGLQDRVWKRLLEQDDVAYSSPGLSVDQSRDIQDWLLPLAAAAMVVLAVGVGIVGSLRGDAPRSSVAQPGTLAGAYVSMTSGGLR